MYRIFGSVRGHSTPNNHVRILLDSTYTFLLHYQHAALESQSSIRLLEKLPHTKKITMSMAYLRILIIEMFHSKKMHIPFHIGPPIPFLLLNVTGEECVLDTVAKAAL